MNEKQILNHLAEYYINDGYQADDADLELVLNFLNESGSLGYFYYITKKFEEFLKSNDSVSESVFQMTMTKWFHDSVENLTFILP